MAVFYGYNPNTPPDDPVFSEFRPMSNYIAGFYLASTTVLGPIRLRQLRVRADSCAVRFTSLWLLACIILDIVSILGLAGKDFGCQVMYEAVFIDVRVCVDRKPNGIGSHLGTHRTQNCVRVCVSVLRYNTSHRTSSISSLSLIHI